MGTADTPAWSSVDDAVAVVVGRTCVPGRVPAAQHRAGDPQQPVGDRAQRLVARPCRRASRLSTTGPRGVSIATPIRAAGAGGADQPVRHRRETRAAVREHLVSPPHSLAVEQAGPVRRPTPTVAEPPGHKSYEGARDTTGDRSLPADPPGPRAHGAEPLECHTGDPCWSPVPSCGQRWVAVGAVRQQGRPLRDLVDSRLGR